MNLVPTTIIEEAIRKGGYGNGRIYYEGFNTGWRRKLKAITCPLPESEIALDPAFWQALAKVSSWYEIQDGDEFVIGTKIESKGYRKAPTDNVVLEMEDKRRAIEATWRLTDFVEPTKTTATYLALKFFALLLSSPTQAEVDAFWKNLP